MGSRRKKGRTLGRIQGGTERPNPPIPRWVQPRAPLGAAAPAAPLHPGPGSHLLPGRGDPPDPPVPAAPELSGAGSCGAGAAAAPGAGEKEEAGVLGHCGARDLSLWIPGRCPPGWVPLPSVGCQAPGVPGGPERRPRCRSLGPAGRAALRGVEVVPVPDAAGGAGRVPVRGPAGRNAALPAPAAPAPLLLHQLRAQRPPGRDPPHRGCRHLPQRE